MRKVGLGLWKGLNVFGGLLSMWFLFVEGFFFVVIILVGWDGFYVFINGKYVILFKYC